MNLENRLEAPASDDGRYRLLVDAITDYAIYMLDAKGIVSSWNPGAARFKGYEADEIIGRHFSQFYTDEERKAGIPDLALKVAASEGRFEREGWRLRKDGTRFWAHVVIDPIRSPSGETIGYAKVTRDLTERRAAEEALRRSQEQFRLLVQGVTDYAIFMLDPEGNVASWNAGAQHIKGYAPEEIIGSHFSRFYTSEDLAEGVPTRGLATAARDGRWEAEGLRKRKDGSTFWAHVVIDAIRDEDGKIIGFAKVTRDITERKEAEQSLQQAQAALAQAQKMEALGQLTGGVAHDFNNLLQVISSNLHLAAKDVAGNPRAEVRIQNALAGVSRGARLAQQLLAFGRRQALEPKVINVGRFVRGMDDMLRRTIGADIEFEISIAGGLWNTLLDPNQVENALLNLAINGRDAMPDGGALTIEAGNAFLDDRYAARHEGVRPGQYVMLAVTDTGSGMPADVVQRAFEPFFSTKPEGKGTGLGLSMVYGLVKQSGGHIKIYSELGHGTTVKLYFPRAHESEDVVTDISSTPLRGGTETILVVEDDEEVRESAVALLSDLGYRVLKAKDGASAMGVIESGLPIDLLFTDVVMPGPVRSPDLARTAKERLPNLAVLFTSGYTENAIVHGGRLDRGVELLGKPYSRDQLARKIRHVLGNQAQRQVAAEEKTSARLQPEIASRPRTILVVEDDELIRSMTCEMLRTLGHEVLEAPDAPAALDMLASNSVDILLTDVGLPRVSGTVLARQARERSSNLRIIIATGDTGAAQDAQEIGATLLQKPYQSADLVRVLD
ncbi:PAS domain S-box protein [Bradyrhizobium diazoefficiens]|uniref:hybrid sensor histidine kinase/response regulator n=1 Tax=Bradyrhizobium diazoefficiens TaxID=1355477 RepID=UPI00272A9B1D|nr:PAS domain S-box protein [Bradyrhizobium diazoefficiens]WLA74209.1 PAS domain S-box protein [Bradyrhizobium diazoefficiens]